MCSMAEIRTDLKKTKRLYRIRWINFYLCLTSTVILALAAIIIFIFGFHLLSGYLAVALVLIIIVYFLIESRCKNLIENA
jgi:hypothetical protein